MKEEKKLGLMPLILMIFTSVYGFNNIPRSYYLMGYAAIPWFVIAGILFFIPFAFMIAEFGSAFRNETGGMYSWMCKSVGPKYAFVGTLMWYTSYILWMVYPQVSGYQFQISFLVRTTQQTGHFLDHSFYLVQDYLD